MKKDHPLGIRLSPADRAALDRAAEAEVLSLSALGRKIVVEWLRKNGWKENGKKE